MSNNETFDIAAWQERMRQPQETEDERAARKALQRKARELSMSPEALSWLTMLDTKLGILAGIIDEQNVKLARQEERIEALENPKPTIWRIGQ